MSIKKAANAAVKRMDDKDAQRLAGMAQALRQQRDAKQAASAAAPAAAPAKQQGFQSMAASTLKNLQQQLNQTPGLKQRVEVAQPTAYQNYATTADYIQQLRTLNPERLISKDIYEAMSDVQSQIDSIKKSEGGNRKNLAQLERKRGELESAYYQQQESERQQDLAVATAPFEQLRKNADFAGVVKTGVAKTQPQFNLDPSIYATGAMLPADNPFAIYSYNVAQENEAARKFQQNVTNPAAWAAQNAEQLLKADATYGGRFLGMTNDRANYLYMTDDEMQLYTYIMETQGGVAANQYYEVLADDLAQRRLETRYQSQAEWAADHPWAAGFLSFATSAAQPVSAAAGALEYAVTGDIDPNSQWNAPAQLTAAMREGANSTIYNSYNALAEELAAKQTNGETVSKEEIDRLEKIGKTADALNSLANIGYSMGDNLVTILSGGGGTASALMMGGEAAGAQMYGSLKTGRTAEQALLDGGVSALIEAATERWSLGNLKALSSASGTLTKQSVKAFLKQLGVNMAKQGAGEMSEEVISEYANTLYDVLRYGKDSEYNKYYVSLLLQGISADEAERMTAEEFLVRRPIEAGKGGFISGALFGGGGTVVGNYQITQARKELANAAGTSSDVHERAASALGMNQTQQAAATALADISDRAQIGTATIADTVAEKVLTGQTPSNSEIRQLQNATTTIQRSFEGMTGIEVVGVDSSNLRASIAAAVKTPAITIEQAAQYADAVAQAQAAAPAPQYDSLRYNAPDASAIGAIDAARQGGAPLDIASAQDTGSAAGMAEDFRQRQAAPRSTKASAETDTAGNHLSAAQAEYFKDSKVRDENGRLIKMYHGSKKKFTVFDSNKSYFGVFGSGMYFTSDSSYAGEYAMSSGRVYQSYLNLENPMDVNAPADINAWNEVVDHLGIERSILNGLTSDATNKDALQAIKDAARDKLTAPWKTPPAKWIDAMKAAGWDGVIDRKAGKWNSTLAVAFDSAQIKRTDNLNPTDDPDIRFRLTGNQYNALALEYALEEGTFNEAQIANLTGQLRDKGIELPDDPTAGELLEAVDMLDTMEPGFVLNITEKVYKTAEQKAAEKAAREKAAADRTERKRLADEEKQRNAVEAEQKKAAIAERRAKAEKTTKKTTKKNTKKAAKNAAPKAPRQKSIASLAAEHKTGTAKVSDYNVNLTDPKAIARGLEGDARAEFVRQMESVNEFGKAFGHTVNYYYGRVGDAGSIPSGFYYNGKIYVNVNSLRAAGLKTVAHEICHDIAAQDPSFVNSFYRLYREYCESNGLMNEFSRRWNNAYNNSIYPNKQLAIAEEVLAEMFGERAEGDSEFLNYCLGKRPGIITRIVESLNRILVKLHLKKYSAAEEDAMRIRNYILGVMAEYSYTRTGRKVPLSATVRADYRSALRKAEAIGDRYAILDDLGVNLAEWNTTGLAAPAEYRNLNRKAPDEVTNYGFKLVVANRKANRVLIVNPYRYVPNEGIHADMVASSRSLAAALGLRLGFISGKTSETVGEGKNRRDIATDVDFLLADDGTVFVNLDSEIPYTKIVAGAWWSQYRKSNPVAAANLERLAERNRALSGDDRIAQDYAVGMLTRTNAQGLKALALDPETLVEKLSDSKSAVYAFAHERPGVIRKLFENAGDMVAKLTKKQDYRAAYISGQLQARLMKAFSETSPNRPGGDKIETVKHKTAPEGVWFMYAGENAKSADQTMLARVQDMIDAGVEPETVRQETGWFKGMDGRWRFEIDDSTAQYHRAGDARFSRMHADYARHQTLLNKMLNGQISPEEHAELRKLDEIWGRERGRLNERVDRGNATLDEILDHEALFEAYPELRNVKVRFEVMYDGERGSYDRKSDTIRLSSNLRDAPADTLLHEIQHAVQSIEGHSGGSSPFYWAAEISAEEMARRLDGERREILSSLNRTDLNKYARFEDLDLAMESMLDREDFENNFELQDHYEKLETESDELYRELHPHEWFRRLQDIRRQHDNPSEIYSNMYHNTAGEIEARDTAARRSLTSEQRKNARPDIDRKDVVFADSGLSNSIVDHIAVLREPARTDPVDTYKRRDLRAKISKEVKALSAALTSPSDKKHVPSKLTAAIADFLKEFTNDTSVFTAAKLAVLRDAYDRLSDTGVDSDMDVSYAYDPNISETISELSDTIDGRRLAQLNMDETIKVRNIVQHFKHLVTAENKMFLEGRKRDVAALGTEIMSELRQRKASQMDLGNMKAVEAFRDMLTSGNITPAYFFKRVGGAMERLFKSMRNGQNVWAMNMKKARQTYESIFKKYHADKWIDKKGDILTFATERGDDIALTRQQALTLYATHQREVTNQIQEAGHLRLGGFVYEDAVKSKRGHTEVNTTNAHPLNENDMRRIIDWLTDDQIQFADELVGYMSGDLAKLGNETSMQLHGWEKFTESYYFPYNSAENYLYTKQAVTEDRRLKHMSFTKSTVRKANNPIVLSDFTQVWANHVQNMLVYSSLAVPLENFNRVYNYKTSVTEDSTSHSVKEAMEQAYGKRANRYINQLLADINSGVRPNPSETFVGAMLSKFKKSAVFASASVVVQQPSAIGRAMALIDPKYFVASTFQRKNWEECKRHCGVALIKEMGRFDTGTGRGASEWLIAQPYRGVQRIGALVTDSAYRDEALSAPAAKADAYTWAAIWNACKREAVKEKGLQPGTKELFEAAAERFDEVVNFTQVYDSVFARSELMRSKSVGAKMLTNFMAEPTVSYNMLYDAFANARRKDVENKVNPVRAVGAFLLSVTLNAVLKSLVTAAREKDEDKSYAEKYLGELVENAINDANPLNLVPYVRDVMSLVQGYSVENSAYEIPSMLVDAVDNLDNDNKTGKEKIMGIVNAVSSMFGLPVKNVVRDVDAIINTAFHTKPLEDTSSTGIVNAVLDKLPGYDNRSSANYARLFNAYVTGDAERAQRILERLKQSGADEADVRTGLRKEAKAQYLSGDLSDEEAIKLLVRHGGHDQHDAYWKVKEWDYDSTKGDDDPNFSKYMRLRDALDSDDLEKAHEAAVELLEHGVTVRTLKSELSKHAGSSDIIYELDLDEYID